jgi:branched-chain amino acid transport system ATP-binding protein
MLLRVENLVVSYGAIRALHGVSLEIDSGEIVALIGANGAGKTTLLRAVSGLLKIGAGTITWQGDPHRPGAAEALHELPPHEIVRRGICHVPEGRQVFPQLTVRENLRLGAYQVRSHETINRRLERCAELFPVLAERHNQRAGTLSGGEQQTLAIGRALMAGPRLLLLDEPSLGLAPMIVKKIFQIIREINAAGTTIFLVEQNAKQALSIANRGYVLQTGRVIKADAAKSLLQDPQVQKAYLGG